MSYLILCRIMVAQKVVKKTVDRAHNTSHRDLEGELVVLPFSQFLKDFKGSPPSTPSYPVSRSGVSSAVGQVSTMLMMALYFWKRIVNYIFTYDIEVKMVSKKMQNIFQHFMSKVLWWEFDKVDRSSFLLVRGKSYGTIKKTSHLKNSVDRWGIEMFSYSY